MNGFDALPPPPTAEVIRQCLPGRMLPSEELCNLIANYGRQCFDAGRINAILSAKDDYD